MVLSLKETSLNYIANSFSQIKNFNHSLLNSHHKQLIIERLTNHNRLFLAKQSPEQTLNYQTKLVNNFFNGHLNQIKFNSCNQLNDEFVKLLINLVRPVDLMIKSIEINKCVNLTGKISFYLFQKASFSNIRLNIFYQN